MIHCICVDDANKPKEIPAEKWVEKGKEYHIIHVSFHPMQGGIRGVTLSEISLDEKCMPYETYKLSRFAIKLEDYGKFIELAESCSDLSKIDIQKLIEESELQVVEN